MRRRPRREPAESEGRGHLALVTDEQTWVARIRAGDERAFEAMYRTYYQPLCAFATACLASREQSEELVQELFCRLWQNRASWQPTQPLVRGYLFNAVRNRVLNQLKHRRIELRFAQMELVAPTVPGPDGVVEAGEFAVALGVALTALPPRCREACVLRWQFDLSYHEIATAMRIAPKTVEGLITRGLKALRASLRAHA